MARNKYPQDTIDKILRVSAKLFVEKGYENTSIQDIIDHLGGLTKGAIYHHFKSKEDIMLEVLDRRFLEYDELQLSRILADEHLTGLEKLRELFRISVVSPHQLELFQSAPRLLNNPKILTIQLQSIKEEVVPRWIMPVLRQGIADGSIQTDYPQELGEVLMLLTNIWITPMVFQGDLQELRRRALFTCQMTKSLGVDFIDEEMLDRLEELAVLYNSEKC